MSQVGIARQCSRQLFDVEEFITKVDTCHGRVVVRDPSTKTMERLFRMTRWKATITFGVGGVATEQKAKQAIIPSTTIPASTVVSFNTDTITASIIVITEWRTNPASTIAAT